MLASHNVPCVVAGRIDHHRPLVGRLPAASSDGVGKLTVTFVGLKEHGLAIVVQTPAGAPTCSTQGPRGRPTTLDVIPSLLC